MKGTLEHSSGTLTPMRTHKSTQKKPSTTQYLSESWKQEH